MTKVLKATISGSFIAGDKEIESFSKVTGYLPLLSTEAPDNGIDVMSKAEQMINKRYAKMWITETKDKDGNPAYKRVGKVREVFMDSIEDVDRDEEFSYVGKSIMDMSFEELQDLAAANDLTDVPFSHQGSLDKARHVAFSRYAVQVLEYDKAKYDHRQQGFNPTKFRPIIADGLIRERGKVARDIEESIDRDVLREEISRANPAKGATDSPLSLDQLKAIAKGKGIQFSDLIGFEALHKRVYGDKAA